MTLSKAAKWMGRILWMPFGFAVGVGLYSEGSVLVAGFGGLIAGLGVLKLADIFVALETKSK